jgi:hypothetical protein
MGGNDLLGQLLGYYDPSPKSNKWWLAIFWWLFNVGVTTAWQVLKLRLRAAGIKAPDHRDFVRVFALQLIGGYCANPAWKQTQNSYLQAGAAQTRKSFLHLPKRAIDADLPARGTCKHCTHGRQVLGEHHRSVWVCSQCLVHLCIECFESYHYNRKE